LKTVYVDPQTRVTRQYVATIGFFDGVHLGHQFLIRHVVQQAQAEGLKSMVITFDTHPRQVLNTDYKPQLLSTLDMKLLRLARTEVDVVAVLHFTPQLAQLSAQQFMRQVLSSQLNVRHLVIGYDNRFGHNRADTFDDYVRYGKALGMQVTQNPAFVFKGIHVSSSVIRAFVGEGQIRLANSCLGYPYTIEGTVVKGFQEGRKMGFPTANLDMDNSLQLLPCNGVYAVKVRLPGSVTYHQGMMNIGMRPTFGGTRRTLEVNLFNFSDDLYGKCLLVSFFYRLRGEIKFDNALQLAEQLHRDCEQIQQQFNSELEK